MLIKSNLLNSTDDSYIELVKNKELILHYDMIKIEMDNKLLCPLISRLFSETLRTNIYKFFIMSYTFPNPIQEYIKALTLLPIDLFLIQSNVYEFNNIFYINNKDNYNLLKFGMILYSNRVKDITFDDVYCFIIDDNDNITKLEKFREGDKMLIKQNKINKDIKDNPDYNCCFVGLSENVKITENLLSNIYKSYNFISLDKLLSENKNTEPLLDTFKIDYKVFNSSPIENNVLINNFPLLFYAGLDNNKKYIDNILNNIFDTFQNYLNLNLENSIIKNKNDIADILNIDENLINDNIALIKTNDNILKLFIKTLIASNNNTEVIALHDYIYNYDTDILNKDNFNLNIDKIKKNMLDEFNKYIEKVFSLI